MIRKLSVKIDFEKDDITWRVQFSSFFNNSTNLGTIPVLITSSMGGLGSLDNNFRNFCVAATCVSTSEL